VLKQGVDHGAFWSEINASPTPRRVVSPKGRKPGHEEDPITKLMVEQRGAAAVQQEGGMMPPELGPKMSRLLFPEDGSAYTGEELPDPGDALTNNPANPINRAHRVAMAGDAMQGYVDSGGMPPSNVMHDAARAGNPDLEAVMARNNHQLQVLNRMAVKESVLKEAGSILSNFVDGRENRVSRVPDEELRRFAYGQTQGRQDIKPAAALRNAPRVGA